MNAAPRVLIVEDEWLVAADLAETLVELGYDVVATVDTGEQAIEAARRLAPDAVLMDVMLRGELDGISAARAIMGQLGCPIVFLTAYTDGRTFERALDTGPASYITKPFHADQVDRALKLAIYRHRAERLREQRRGLIEQSLAVLGEGVVVVDRRLRVVLANPAATELLGAAPELHMPLSLSLEQVPADQAAAMLDDLRRCIDGAAESPHDDAPVARHWRVRPLPDRQGRITSAALIVDAQPPPAATPPGSTPAPGSAPPPEVRICSWSRRVYDRERGGWVDFEDYFERHFGIRFTYGISPQALSELDIEDL